MPQVQHIKETDYQIVVWKYNSLDELILENDKGIFVPEHLTSNKRKAEYLSTRFALHTINPEEIVRYLDSGKPVTTEGNISFSHTANYSVAIKGKHPIGVDIEKKKTKILKIQERFLHKSESWAKDKIELLHVIWGAKEVLYKTYDLQGTIFSDDIIIEDFELQSEFYFTARFFSKGSWVVHELKCIIFEDVYLIFNAS